MSWANEITSSRGRKKNKKKITGIRKLRFAKLENIDASWKQKSLHGY